MNTDEIDRIDYESYARAVSELFERDSRRFNRALSEEAEAKAG